MKRLFWLGVGAAFGATGTVWAERKVKNQIEALAPDQLVIRAGQKAGDAGRSILDAVSEGRDAMRARETELRGQYQPTVRHPRRSSHGGPRTSPGHR